MVFTLHRYIFYEAFRVFVLATLALTLMLSLGSIIEPLQKYGIGPQQVVHLIVYFLPITLTFVLPMAALFATSLVYGRFASDNELDACKASGISMLTLVYPGLALAIMVAIANLILSFHVMPAFVHRAVKSVKADTKQIIFRNIQRKGYYKVPSSRYQIYADLADPRQNTLFGVVITEVKGRAIETITTAKSATINFDSPGRFNEVQITAYDTYQMGPDTVELGVSVITAEFPSLLSDDIKFKKVGEMKRIRDVDLMAFSPIAKLAGDVYAQYTTELLAQDIAEKISAAGDSFYKLHSGQKLVEFAAAACKPRKDAEIELTGDVVVRVYDINNKNQPLRILRCAKALLHIEGDKLSPTLTMILFNATWRQADGVEVLDRRPIFRGLIVPAQVTPEAFLSEGVTDKFETAVVLKAIEPDLVSAALSNGPSAKLMALQDGLQTKIQRTLAEISAEIHSRLVFGIGCVPLIMIGIGLGIIKRGGHMLSAFGASSVPAAVLIVCLMMGKNITKNPQSQAGSGIALIWMSLVLLSLLAIVTYRKLLKN